jgi:phosphate:Na+ symporter
MYAAKNFKDALPDIQQLRNSSNDIKFEFYKDTKKVVQHFFEMNAALLLQDEPVTADNLALVYQSVTEGYTNTLRRLYHNTTAGKVNETEISTLLNFNREIHTAFKSLFFGLKDFLLDKNQSRHFDELPGFIR